MSRLMSLIALIAVIVVIGLLFYKVMVGFFVPVFLAAVLVVVFRPLHLFVLRKTGNRPKLSAVLTTCLIMLSVIVPFGLIGTTAALQSVGLIQDFNAGSVKVALAKLRNHFGLTLEHEALFRQIQAEFDSLRFRSSLVDNSDPRGGAVTVSGGGETRHSEELSRLSRATADALTALRTAVMTPAFGEMHPGLDERFDTLITQVRQFGDLHEDEFSFEDNATRLSSSFRTLRAEILGGPYLAALKDLANPTDKQISSITQQIVEFIQPRLLSLTSATFGFVVRAVIGCAILIVCIFFFLYDGPGMVKTLMDLIPLDDRYEAELLMEFDRVSRAIVLATIFSAITQGLFAGLGYYVAGLPSLSLLILLTTMFAMIPFVGPAIVWIPACFYLAFYENQVSAAIGLALWGVLVVGTVDNFVKAGVLHGQSQLHPLLALLSVLGGVQALGPIGIVVGPMAVVLLQTSLSILQREMVHLEDHGFLNGRRTDATRRFRLRRRRKKESPQPEAQLSSPLPPGGTMPAGKALADAAAPSRANAGTANTGTANAGPGQTSDGATA